MKKIMVVDDEDDIRETVKAVLKQAGFEVVLAKNADDCLKKLPKNPVDLILLDIMMPGMPVRDLLPRIKNQKIAFLSVVRTSEAEKEELFKQKNVVDFIQKPFDIDALTQKIKELLGE